MNSLVTANNLIPREILLRKIMYRSLHRGCKETDIILGNYAKASAQNFDDEKLALYHDFLDESDAEIYDWILDKIAVPVRYQELVTEIKFTL